MLEVPITRLVRKGIRRVKQALHLTNLQLRAGEFELDDMGNDDPTVLGRIDIVLQFLHQFGDDDAYVAIECKRVGAGLSQLNARYVSEGVHRFSTGQYAAGHDWGIMLGYVLALPVENAVSNIDGHIRRRYGKASSLEPRPKHALALALLVGSLVQGKGPHKIRLLHVFVDMTGAALAA
jgi:hypothetical protein